MTETHKAQMPEGIAPYKRTQTFSKMTVPNGLTKDHATKEGVWGMINVIAGELVYTVPGAGTKLTLAEGDTAVIEPTVLHNVALNAEAQFFVEFWR